jgi:hypothetical protein
VAMAVKSRAGWCARGPEVTWIGESVETDLDWVLVWVLMS